jgi:hypothetical protein
MSYKQDVNYQRGVHQKVTHNLIAPKSNIKLDVQVVYIIMINMYLFCKISSCYNATNL